MTLMHGKFSTFEIFRRSFAKMLYRQMQFRFPKPYFLYSKLANVSSKFGKCFFSNSMFAHISGPSEGIYGILEYARMDENLYFEIVLFCFHFSFEKKNTCARSLLIDSLKHFIFRVFIFFNLFEIFDMSFQTIFGIYWVLSHVTSCVWLRQERWRAGECLSPMLFIENET